MCLLSYRLLNKEAFPVLKRKMAPLLHAEGKPEYVRELQGYPLRTRYGRFNIFQYVNPDPNAHDLDNRTLPEHHYAAVKGEVAGKPDVLVRIQSKCMMSEVFRDVSCDCDAQKVAAMERINREGNGVLVYLMQDGKGNGALNKVRASALAHKEGIDMYDVK